jgi:hypothetical protein
MTLTMQADLQVGRICRLVSSTISAGIDISTDVNMQLAISSILCTYAEGRALNFSFPSNMTIADEYWGTSHDDGFQSSLHLSTCFAGMILLLFMLYHIRAEGYQLSRAWFHSTDFLMWLLMIWVSNYGVDTHSCPFGCDVRRSPAEILSFTRW